MAKEPRPKGYPKLRVSSTVTWIPEETIPRRVKANSVPYDIWEKQGYIMSTEGNVIHYDFIEKFIMDLSEKYHILEVTVDRWNATHVIQKYESFVKLVGCKKA